MSCFISPNIINNGAVLYLDAANTKSYPGSGTVWNDLSGNGLNASLVGPTFSTSNNGIFNFNGTGNYATVPYTSLLAPTTAISFSVWSNTDWQTANDVRFLSKTEGGGWNLAINDAGAGANRISGVVHISGAYSYASVDKTTVSSGYHNLTLTCDGQFLILYIDGKTVAATNRGSVGTLTYANNNSLMIAAEASASTTPTGSYLNGAISAAIVYNRALTDAEVQQNFNALRGRYGI